MPRSDEANQRIREETTRRILSAAREAFARKGSGATMAEIASVAGVSQGLAYRYFPSKEAILTTLIEEGAMSEGGPAARLRKVEGTPGERLELLIGSIVEDRRERPEFYRFLYQAISDQSLAPDLRRVARKNGRVIQEEIRRLIVEAQATGEIAKDDPDQLMTALMSVVDGLARWTPLYDRESKDPFPRSGIVLRLLRPDPSGRQGR